MTTTMNPARSAFQTARAVPSLFAALLLFVVQAQAGGMLVSGRDPALAINAWGGAQPGAPLRLHNGCRPDNGDCSWTYRGGLLVSDKDPALAIKSAGTGSNAALVLARGCQRATPGCGWTYRDGLFVSDANPALAIGAVGGARYGTPLRLSDGCRSGNPDCTWSRPR